MGIKIILFSKWYEHDLWLLALVLLKAVPGFEFPLLHKSSIYIVTVALRFELNFGGRSCMT